MSDAGRKMRRIKPATTVPMGERPLPALPSLARETERRMVLDEMDRIDRRLAESAARLRKGEATWADIVLIAFSKPRP